MKVDHPELNEIRWRYDFRRGFDPTIYCEGGGCKGKERWYKGWKEIQSEKKKTRPDTVLSQSRAGGQGLCLRSFHELGRSIGWTDGRMGQRTDGPTDGQINGPT